MEAVAKAIGFDKLHFRHENYYNSSDTDKRFILLGDSYVWDVLSRGLLQIQSKIPQLRGKQKKESQRLLNALKCVVLRERWGVSLWKRMDEYDRISSELKRVFRDTVTAPPDVDEWTGPLLNWIGDYALSAPRILEPLQAALDESAKQFGCWTLIEPPRGLGMDHDDRIIVKQNGECRAIPLTRVSTVAKGLADAWKSDVHLYVFVFSDTQPWSERSDEAKVRESLTKAFVEAVVNTYKTVASWQKQLTGFLKNRVIEKEAS